MVKKPPRKTRAPKTNTQAESGPGVAADEERDLRWSFRAAYRLDGDFGDAFARWRATDARQWAARVEAAAAAAMGPVTKLLRQRLLDRAAEARAGHDDTAMYRAS